MMMAYLTIFAILLGPVLGVGFAIWLERRRAKEARRLDIFRTLMRTRRARISPDHVGALNLVEIEFRDDPDVVSNWKALLDHFGKAQPRHPNEEIQNGMESKETDTRENRYSLRVVQERQELLTKLLSEIAKAVGFNNIEQLDIFKGGYTPQGWEDTEFDQLVIRRLFVDISLGRKVLPVGIVNWPDQSASQENHVAYPPERDAG